MKSQKRETERKTKILNHSYGQSYLIENGNQYEFWNVNEFVFVIHGSKKREIEKGRKINHSQSVLNLKENGN